MRLAAVAVVVTVVAGLSPLQAAAANGLPDQTNLLRILSGRTNDIKEDFYKRKAQTRAVHMKDAMFGALAKVLGGQAPDLNFVSGINSAEEAHLSATPGANRINIDPYATQGFVDASARTHSGAVNAVPHEMAHLRQTAAILASVAQREGGAQAFADIVTPIAAAAAKTSYNGGNYDGGYADFVKQAQARGRDWLFGTQFGHAPVSWP